MSSNDLTTVTNMGSEPRFLLYSLCCVCLVSSILLYNESSCDWLILLSIRKFHLFSHPVSVLSYMPADGHCQSLCLLKYLCINVFDPTQSPLDFWKVTAESLWVKVKYWHLRVQEDWWMYFWLVSTGKWLANPGHYPNNLSQRNALGFHVFDFGGLGFCFCL